MIRIALTGSLRSTSRSLFSSLRFFTTHDALKMDIIPDQENQFHQQLFPNKTKISIGEIKDYVNKLSTIYNSAPSQIKRFLA